MCNLSFEKAEERLQEIVKELETGECTLNKSIELYDEGLKLASLCTKKLNEAKQKIVTLEQYIKEQNTNE